MGGAGGRKLACTVYPQPPSMGNLDCVDDLGIIGSLCELRNLDGDLVELVDLSNFHDMSYQLSHPRNSAT